MRSITIDELQGFRDALIELSVQVDLGDGLTDIVGTGGDGKNTFNISTVACFLVAGAGHKVAKHGNYGATSVSGASDVMQFLGYRFKNTQPEMQREIDEANFTYMHAPLFHPALKVVAPLRKNIGFRTFFNTLGPLVNPSKPSHQLIGVSSQELSRIYTYMMQAEKNNFTIVHTLDGYDEISLTSDTKVVTANGEKIFSAYQLGKRTVTPGDIYGGNSIEDAARIFTKILKCEGSWPQNAVVLANAAMALHCGGSFKNYDEAYNAAVESLESGNAYKMFQKLIALQ